MPNTTTRFQTIVIIDCCRCSGPIALTDVQESQRRKDGKTFYCTEGHGQSWHETEADRLRKQLKRVEADRDEAQRRSNRLSEDNMNLAASRAAIKGHVTRLRKRAQAGVCDLCRRHFVNVERHMASKHSSVTA